MSVVHSASHEVEKARSERSLTVNVFSARNLAAKDLPPKSSDPYLKIKLLDENGAVIEKQKSHVCKKTTHPVWAPQASYSDWKFENSFRKIRIEIWDKDWLTRDDFLGSVTFDCVKLSESERISGWFKLQARPGKAQTVRGEINLQISYVAKYMDTPLTTLPPMTSLKKPSLVAPTLFVTVVEGNDCFPFHGHLTARKAKNTKESNWVNPYCVVKFQDQEVRTKTLRCTVSPVWSFQHAFQISEAISQGVDSTAVLEVRMLDWDRAKIRDPVIGTVSIPLNCVKVGWTVDQWFPLTLPNGPSLENPHAIPSIHLIIKYHDPHKVKRYTWYVAIAVFAALMLGLFVERVFGAVHPLLGLAVSVLVLFTVAYKAYQYYDIAIVHRPAPRPGTGHVPFDADALRPPSFTGLSREVKLMEPVKAVKIPPLIQRSKPT
mmetsp:Transcript_37081/g.72840  ORF Transcript_37081/g.72840 Transcript_37081/m.72840 type:complete len:433 (+) Transcript_37081:30-1328(+)